MIKKILKLLLTLCFMFSCLEDVHKIKANEWAAMRQYPTYCLYDKWGQITCEYVTLPATLNLIHYSKTITMSGEDHEYHCYHVVGSTVVYGYCTKVNHS
ncbi:MAG: hypothetical protein ACI4U3_03915 [Traorella sp.]